MESRNVEFVLENTGTCALAVMHMTSYTRQVLAGFEVKAENLAEIREGGRDMESRKNVSALRKICRCSTAALV